MKRTIEILCWTVATLMVGGVVAMTAFGWLTVHNTDDETNINIDRQEIREDIDKAVEQGRKLLKDKEDEPKDGARAKEDRLK